MKLRGHFKEKTLYKHKNNTDVAIQVLYEYRPHGDHQSFHVVWWNVVRPHKEFCYNYEETIKIKTEDILNWKYYPKLIP